MLLTQTQKDTIRTTWKVVKERMDNSNTELGRAIFLRLLEDAPTIQELFPFKDETPEELKTSKKLGRHGANFVRQVEKAIEGMDKLFSEVGPRLVALGTRHYGYGTEEAHYVVVGQTLLHVLKTVLGSECTPEVEDAFSALYDIISEAMLEGGRDH